MNTVHNMDIKKCVDICDEWDDTYDLEFDEFSDAITRSDEKEKKKKEIAKQTRLLR